MNYKHLLVSILIILQASCLTASMDDESPVSPPRQVFAHYMTCFFDSVEAYEYEIALAQRSGIDGFALNCGEWMKSKDGEVIETGYVSAAERMYQAAKNLNSGFKLFISVDAAGIRDYDLNVTDMVKRFYHHPNQLRQGEIPVLSTYSGKASRYVEPLNALDEENYPVFFVPNFHSFHRYSMRLSSEQITKLFVKNPILDGFFNFATDDSINGIISSNANGSKAAVMTDKIYMAGNSPAYNSPNLRDFQLGRGYGAIWEGIIRDGTPWVELTTWNDYAEDSHLAPRTFHQMSKDVQDHDETYLLLTEYYAKWFKTGEAPRIEQDKLFYNYRTRTTDQTKAWLYADNKAREPQEVDITRGLKKIDQIHDDVQNNVYVTTFLTEDATLEVSIGDVQQQFIMKQGVNTVDVPLSPGVPQFKLIRNDHELLNIFGRRSIIEKEDVKNSFQVDHHQQNRTWTGGAAVGTPSVFKAVDARILGNAQKVNDAVSIDSSGAGVAFPFSHLKSGCYNIRVRYKNTDSDDARLTLNATGSPMPIAEGKENPYHMPLFLPPTGDRFRTVSFFWSLFEATDELSIIYQSEEEKPWRTSELTQLLGDRGAVLIDSIEWVYVPELIEQEKADWDWVLIPGGSFTMGTDVGKPDEAPAHQVEVSTFAMAKYELTNAEYERYDPTHRQYRDGLSWRDDEPVIYVSWRDIAKYCNWLSKEHGLELVYDEKTFAIDRDANGFRMPTEAEWEYVATGRGEGFEYPWGNEAPQPGMHGNFVGRKAIDEVKPHLRSTFEQGAMVVGSYPAGASRDGIMDMAGNVGEWCLDTYLPYSNEAQSNPLEVGKSHSRVMRGGTWTYYNYSQRSREREFNSPGYPGFSYVGARLVVSEAGYGILMEKEN